MDNGRGPDLQDRNLGAKIDSCAAQLPSRQARDFYLAGRRPRAGGRQSVSESPAEVRPRAALRISLRRPGNIRADRAMVGRRLEGLYFPRVSLADFSRGVPPEAAPLPGTDEKR